MGIESLEHPVDGAVLDVAQLDVLFVLQLLLQERKHLPKPARQFPGARYVGDGELALGAVDLNGQRVRAFAIVHQDRRHVLLDRVESGQHHALVVDAPRVDVVVVHLVNHPIHHLQLGEVPGRLLARGLGPRRGVEVDL